MNKPIEPGEQQARSSENSDSTDSAAADLGRQFLFARFQHNRNKLQNNPEFEALFAKQEEWTDEDVENFKSLIGDLKL